MKSSRDNIIFKYHKTVIVLGLQEFNTIEGYYSYENNTCYICINQNYSDKAKVLHKFLRYHRNKKLDKKMLMLGNSKNIIYKS